MGKGGEKRDKWEDMSDADVARLRASLTTHLIDDLRSTEHAPHMLLEFWAVKGVHHHVGVGWVHAGALKKLSTNRCHVRPSQVSTIEGSERVIGELLAGAEVGRNSMRSRVFAGRRTCCSGVGSSSGRRGSCRGRGSWCGGRLRGSSSSGLDQMNGVVILEFVFGERLLILQDLARVNETLAVGRRDMR